MDFIFFNIILLLVIAFLFVILSWIWPPDSPWAPWWRTSKQVAEDLCKLAKIKKSDILYDLGCGDGEVLITAAKYYGAKGVGVEIDPPRAYIAQLRVKFAKLSDKVSILRKNFFQVDISPASVVIVYLVPKALKRLKKKMLQELRPGVRVVSYRYTIPFLPLIGEDRKNRLYMYEIPKKAKLSAAK